MGRAFLALYTCTGDRSWLQKAARAVEFISKKFFNRPGNTGNKSPADCPPSPPGTKNSPESALERRIPFSAFASDAPRSNAIFVARDFRAIVAGMSDEPDTKSYEGRAWQYFLQLQPTITDVNAAAELAFRAVDAFDRSLKRRQSQQS